MIHGSSRWVAGVVLLITGLNGAFAKADGKRPQSSAAKAPNEATAEQAQKASGGGSSGSRGGGDIELPREDDIKTYLAGSLKSDVSAYLKNMSFQGANSDLLEQLWVLRKGIDADLDSPYIPVDHCKDRFGIERSACTDQNGFHSIIYFNLSRLISSKADKLDLLALAVHEHARHFGFEDTAPENVRNPIYLFVERSLRFRSGIDDLVAQLIQAPEYIAFKAGLGRTDPPTIEIPRRYSAGFWRSTGQGLKCNMTYKVIMKFGSDAFLFKLVEEFAPGTNCREENLVKREIHWERYEIEPLLNLSSHACGCQLASDSEPEGELVIDWKTHAMIARLKSFDECLAFIKRGEQGCRVATNVEYP